jgi:polysaccharide export outer membrane protein
MRRRLALPVSISVVLVGALVGCSGPNIGDNVRVGTAAYGIIPAPAGEPVVQDYRIGPLDTVDITVFQEADISSRGALVDAAGDISMPLVGRVRAAGRTPTELAEDLRGKLAERFYQNPQVTVAVSSSVSQRVTVQGQVTEPGIYQISGATTLLDTISLAKGETENAALGQVLIIRYIGGERMAAAFDIARIRRGDDKDPAILARDTIVVGHSNGKQIWHDLLRAAPLLNVFTQF